ncbi:hypothetical protein [Psittacicella hinzii]|uniref:DUF3570 domain-containing protein n=1 Tax=Psittacicella hinzii TaxID=2028575 RepID=A0A3A1YQU9_9GAMM|nr:hypothetical protein [Psittacicella hinzii]RIY39856.1 hypothetical protein CKF58_01435 [Psittacicella hinzii]
MVRPLLLGIGLLAFMTTATQARVTLTTWNDGKSSLQSIWQVRFGYSYSTQYNSYQTYERNTQTPTWNLRPRISFMLNQYINDDLTVGGYVRFMHIFMSRHSRSMNYDYSTGTYSDVTYTATHGKNPIRADRGHFYLDSKTLGRLTVALSTGLYPTQQGAGDVRDFGTNTWFLSNQSRAITYAYLDTQDRLVRYDSPELSADIPLQVSVSYGDMRSNQTNDAGQIKRRYDTEVSGALIYNLPQYKGYVSLLAAQKHVYANYTTKYPTTGYQLMSKFSPIENLMVRAEVGLAKEETATVYNRYRGAGVDLDYRIGRFEPYGGILYMHTITNNKSSGLQQEKKAYEVYVGTTYDLATKVANAFNFMLFAEALHSYVRYEKNYAARLSDHVYTFGGGLLITW